MKELIKENIISNLNIEFYKLYSELSKNTIKYEEKGRNDILYKMAFTVNDHTLKLLRDYKYKIDNLFKDCNDE
jgi:hypothetical protein